MTGPYTLAYYKHIHHFAVQTGTEFDDVHAADTPAPLSGVYRCEGCGRSIIARNGALLPSADHHAHSDARKVEWRLIVRSHWS